MEFRSVDPGRNRNRRYALTIQLTVDGGVELLISWGRIGCRGRQRMESFQTRTALQHRYALLVARRRRHGYEAVGEQSLLLSDTTPPSLTVDRGSRFIPMLQKNGYFGVFDSQSHGFIVRDVDPDVDPVALRAWAEQLCGAAGSHVDQVDSSGVISSRAA